jgi:hypothetical protein
MTASALRRTAATGAERLPRFAGLRGIFMPPCSVGIVARDPAIQR